MTALAKCHADLDFANASPSCCFDLCSQQSRHSPNSKASCSSFPAGCRCNAIRFAAAPSLPRLSETVSKFRKCGNSNKQGLSTMMHYAMAPCVWRWHGANPSMQFIQNTHNGARDVRLQFGRTPILVASMAHTACCTACSSVQPCRTPHLAPL